MTLAVLCASADPSDIAAVETISSTVQISLGYDPDETAVTLPEKTFRLRYAVGAVTHCGLRCRRCHGVRTAGQCSEQWLRAGSIVEGRDIGTVVFQMRR